MEYKLERIKPRPQGRYLVKAPPGYPGIKYGGLYTYEHRAVWWLHYGYIPSKGFHIHHINGDFTDNRIENLEIISQEEHSKHKHNGGKKPKTFIELECAYCKTKFIQKESSVNYRKSLGQTVFYCTKSCQVTVENRNKKGTKTNYPKNRKNTIVKQGVTLICKACQKEYYVCKYKEHISKTCSKPCSYIYKSLQMKK